MLNILTLFMLADLVGFPDQVVAARAEYHLATARTMFSDYPELNRFMWSYSLETPCLDELQYSSGGDGEQPCGMEPFFPDPRYSMPFALLTGYQKLVYTPPKDGSSSKAGLAVSWEYTLISAGVSWVLTINASGIQQDIWYCVYDRVRRRIEIAPLVFINVWYLRPSQYLQFTLKPNGTYNLQEHKIRQWDLPMSLSSLGMMYDVRIRQPRCGTMTYVYTTKPGEILGDIMGSFLPDATEVLPGDQQRVVTPFLGSRDCGEFSYAGFYGFMTHRPAPTPSMYADGPPLEVWSFQAERDASASTATVLDDSASNDHSQVAAVQNNLTETGQGGAFVKDPDMNAAMNAQASLEDQRYKDGLDLVKAAQALVGALSANPDNDLLWQVYSTHIAPNLDYLDVLNDSEIEFNPFLDHCEREAKSGHLPILGEHYFPDGMPDCGFCTYHDIITAQPRQGWSHQRLVYVDWLWGSIHSEEGNLREKAHHFMRQQIFASELQAKKSIKDTQNELAEFQLEEVHQGQVEGTSLESLEGEPSPTTQNQASALDAEAVPYFLGIPFDRCTDPSWTLEYLELFHELGDVFDSPCDRLMGVQR